MAPPISSKSPQGQHQQAPLTPEQLASVRRATEAAVKTDPQHLEELPTQTQQTESTHSTGDADELQHQQTGSPRDKPGARSDPGKKTSYHHEPNETRGSQLPNTLGRRGPDLTPLLNRQQGEDGGHTAARDLPTSAFEQPDAAHFSRDLPDRPLPDRPPGPHYRNLAQGKAFQGPMNGSPLHQKLQAKALEQNRREQVVGERRGFDENLTKGELGQLFRMRNAFEKKDDVSKVLRYELAKARKEAKEKVKALRYQNEGSSQKEESKTRRAERLRSEGDPLKEQLAGKLKNTSGESAFEQILQQVLDGGESVPDLPESVRARFTAKTEAEWEQFFKNALALNSSEVESEGQLDKLIEALFRGTYRRGADGKMMLVSDLSFAGEMEGESVDHKFSRIALNDPDLMALLENLKPGDVINKELLKKIGDQFLFIQLLHVVDQMAVSEEQKKAILKEFRQQVSSGSRDNLEKALRERRERNARDDTGFPNPLAASAGDQFNKKDRHVGPPKLVLYMIYGVLAVAVVMIVFILLRNFL